MNICSVLNILQPPPRWKGSCPFDSEKLTCRHGDYGRAAFRTYGPRRGPRSAGGANGLSEEENTGQEMISKIWNIKNAPKSGVPPGRLCFYRQTNTIICHSDNDKSFTQKKPLSLTSFLLIIITAYLFDSCNLRADAGFYSYRCFPCWCTGLTGA